MPLLASQKYGKELTIWDEIIAFCIGQFAAKKHNRPLSLLQSSSNMGVRDVYTKDEGKVEGR